MLSAKGAQTHLMICVGWLKLATAGPQKYGRKYRGLLNQTLARVGRCGWKMAVVNEQEIIKHCDPLYL